MKSLKSLCLLGFANLECPAEAFDLAEADKKYRKGSAIEVVGKAVKNQADNWFYEYQEAHRSFDQEASAGGNMFRVINPYRV